MKRRIFNYHSRNPLLALPHTSGLRQRSLGVLLYLAVGFAAAAKGPNEQGRDTFPSYIPFNGATFEFLEGVAVDKVGNVFVSMRSSPVGPLPLPDQIWKFSPAGEKSKYAEFDSPGGGGCGLAVDAEGNVYMARNTVPGKGVYRVEASGKILLLPGTEQIIFPDGLAFDQRGNLYITESYSLSAGEPGGFGQAGIWRVPKGGGPAEIWLRHELLTGVYPPRVFPYPIGANGIIFYHNALYLNNTDKATVVRVPVQPDGTPGEPGVWAQLQELPGPFSQIGFPLLPDGISMDVHGNVYIAIPSREAVVRINATDGSQETIASLPDFPLDGPVSLAFGTGKGNRESLFVTNLGYSGLLVPGMSFPGPGLIKIEIGIPGLPLP